MTLMTILSDLLIALIFLIAMAAFWYSEDGEEW